MDASNNFQGTAQLATGTTTVTVKAKDASGNETTQQYDVDASGSTSSYTYDANGNLTADGTMTYFWNALNQLVEVKEAPTTIATFEYDGDGRRAQKVAAGLTHQYIYDVEDIVEERISGSGSDTIRYYHGAGIDEPLARRNSGDVVTYYLGDHLGSIVQESSAAGAITLEREYDPWGAGIQGASTSGYAFTGREWDAEPQLHYYRARYYSPAMGRFLSEDPIGFSAGSNFYAYVKNSSVRAVDPSGLEDIIVIENGPTDGNPFGHTAIAITGHGVYSYGNSTKLGSSIEDYLTREALRRTTVVYVIPTAKSQDQAALNAVVSPGGMGVLTNNCASRSNRILDAAGIPYPSSANLEAPAIFFPNLPGTAGTRAADAGGTQYVIPQGGSIPEGLLRSIR